MDAAIQAAQITAIITATTGIAALAHAIILRINGPNSSRKSRKIGKYLWISGASITLTMAATAAGISLDQGIPEQAETSPGMTDDNRDWQGYLEYHRRFQRANILGPAPSPNLEQRALVRVRDQDGNPVPGAIIQLQDGRSYRTQADGAALIFPDPGWDGTITARKGQKSARAVIVPDGTWTATLSLTGPAPTNRTDIVLLVDAKGPEALKPLTQALWKFRDSVPRGVQLGTVLYQSRLPGRPPIHHDLHPDPGVAARAIREIPEGSAPEPLGTAIHEAAHHAHWRDDADRVLIILATTPLDTRKSGEDGYLAQMERLQQMGIRTHTIATGPPKPPGEFILRQLAQQTRGRFTILQSPETAGEIVMDLMQQELHQHPQ